MKFFHFIAGEEVHLGAVENSRRVDLTATSGLDELSSLDAMLWADAAEDAHTCFEQENAAAVPENPEFASVLLNPSKILCVGKNYTDHIREIGEPASETPDIFCKLSNTINGHEGTIFLPKTARQYDYEAELTVVMGKACREVSAEQASGFIFGYTCGMDFSAREVQKRQSQWILGKNFDGGCPMGPYVVPANEVDVHHLDIACRVNGEERQRSNSAYMIHTPEELVSYISQYMTLLPGDCILTGTPAGVILGMPPEKRCWLKDGDVVEVEIGQIGILRNRMKAE